MLTADVERVISPRDAMFAGNETHYFETGRKALDVVREFADDPRTILDLPCGHGRVLRWLRAAYPEAKITACDLDRDGVDFCARTFDAAPVYSSDDLSEVKLGRFEAIWCGSLFTHLDAPRWDEFLSFFRRHLDGVLIFTTLGPYAASLPNYFRVRPERKAKMLADFEREGFGYAEYTSQPGYGQAIASPEYVEHRVRAAGLELVSHREQGWYPTQDVVVTSSP